ncbi:MAG: helix-turn-helix domain-containing protein [Egibacteraceae bacterium]
MTEHTSWKEIKARAGVNSTPERRARYDEAGRDLALGQIVYDLRMAAGLTQAQLAERMGTTQAAISRLEGGGGAQRLDTLLRLAVALGRGLTLTFTATGEPDSAELVLRDPAA